MLEALEVVGSSKPTEEGMGFLFDSGGTEDRSLADGSRALSVCGTRFLNAADRIDAILHRRHFILRSKY